MELAPRQAGLVQRVDAWPHSSLPAHLGQVPAPAWLDVDGLHGHLLAVRRARRRDHRRAATRYLELLKREPGFDPWTGPCGGGRSFWAMRPLWAACCRAAYGHASRAFGTLGACAMAGNWCERYPTVPRPSSPHTSRVA